MINKDVRDARHDQEQLQALHRLDEECVHLQRAGNYLQAFDNMERALVLRRHFFGADSPEVTHACRALAEMCNLLSMSFLQQDNFAVTVELLKKAEILSHHHPKEKATTLNNLACYYRRLGKLHTAMTCLKKALSIEKKTLKDARNAADTHLNICAVLSQLGNHQKALEHAQAALITLQEEFFTKPKIANVGDSDGASQSNTQQLERVSVMCIAYHNMGVEQEFLHDFEGCVLSYKKGVGLAEQYLGVDHAIATTIRNSYLAAKRTISTKTSSARRGTEGVSPVGKKNPRLSTPPSSLRLPSPVTRDKQHRQELPSPRSIVADALARGNTLPPLEPVQKKIAPLLTPEDPFFSPRFRFDGGDDDSKAKAKKKAQAQSPRTAEEAPESETVVTHAEVIAEADTIRTTTVDDHTKLAHLPKAHGEAGDLTDDGGYLVSEPVTMEETHATDEEPSASTVVGVHEPRTASDDFTRVDADESVPDDEVSPNKETVSDMSGESVAVPTAEDSSEMVEASADDSSEMVEASADEKLIYHELDIQGPQANTAATDVVEHEASVNTSDHGPELARQMGEAEIATSPTEGEDKTPEVPAEEGHENPEVQAEGELIQNTVEPQTDFSNTEHVVGIESDESTSVPALEEAQEIESTQVQPEPSANITPEPSPEHGELVQLEMEPSREQEIAHWETHVNDAVEAPVELSSEDHPDVIVENQLDAVPHDTAWQEVTAETRTYDNVYTHEAADPAAENAAVQWDPQAEGLSQYQVAEAHGQEDQVNFQAHDEMSTASGEEAVQERYHQPEEMGWEPTQHPSDDEYQHPVHVADGSEDLASQANTTTDAHEAYPAEWPSQELASEELPDSTGLWSATGIMHEAEGLEGHAGSYDATPIEHTHHDDVDDPLLVESEVVGLVITTGDHEAVASSSNAVKV